MCFCLTLRKNSGTSRVYIWLLLKPTVHACVGENVKCHRCATTFRLPPASVLPHAPARRLEILMIQQHTCPPSRLRVHRKQFFCPHTRALRASAAHPTATTAQCRPPPPPLGDCPHPPTSPPLPHERKPRSTDHGYVPLQVEAAAPVSQAAPWFACPQAAKPHPPSRRFPSLPPLELPLYKSGLIFSLLTGSSRFGSIGFVTGEGLRVSEWIDLGFCSKICGGGQWRPRGR